MNSSDYFSSFSTSAFANGAAFSSGHLSPFRNTEGPSAQKLDRMKQPESRTHVHRLSLPKQLEQSLCAAHFEAASCSCFHRLQPEASWKQPTSAIMHSEEHSPPCQLLPISIHAKHFARGSRDVFKKPLELDPCLASAVVEMSVVFAAAGQISPCLTTKCSGPQ